jgi:cysteine-rich repeat protein
MEECDYRDCGGPCLENCYLAHNGSCVCELIEGCTAVCGNGIVEEGEDCDDGNNINGDGCSSTCQLEHVPSVCGDGVVEGIEECDDGNTISGDGCSSTCQLELPGCGNGIVEEGEECDDGNNINGDGCTSSCLDECFHISDISSWSECIDGYRYGTPVYSYYPGLPADHPNCTDLPTVMPCFCGDNFTDSGEECDDGNNVSGDGCSSTCFIECRYPKTYDWSKCLDGVQYPIVSEWAYLADVRNDSPDCPHVGSRPCFDNDNGMRV